MCFAETSFREPNTARAQGGKALTADATARSVAKQSTVAKPAMRKMLQVFSVSSGTVATGEEAIFRLARARVLAGLRQVSGRMREVAAAQRKFQTALGVLDKRVAHLAQNMEGAREEPDVQLAFWSGVGPGGRARVAGGVARRLSQAGGRVSARVARGFRQSMLGSRKGSLAGSHAPDNDGGSRRTIPPHHRAHYQQPQQSLQPRRAAASPPSRHWNSDHSMSMLSAFDRRAAAARSADWVLRDRDGGPQELAPPFGLVEEGAGQHHLGPMSKSAVGLGLGGSMRAYDRGLPDSPSKRGLAMRAQGLGAGRVRGGAGVRTVRRPKPPAAAHTAAAADEEEGAPPPTLARALTSSDADGSFASIAAAAHPLTIERQRSTAASGAPLSSGPPSVFGASSAGGGKHSDRYSQPRDAEGVPYGRVKAPLVKEKRAQAPGEGAAAAAARSGRGGEVVASPHAGAGGKRPLVMERRSSMLSPDGAGWGLLAAGAPKASSAELRPSVAGGKTKRGSHSPRQKPRGAGAGAGAGKRRSRPESDQSETAGSSSGDSDDDSGAEQIIEGSRRPRGRSSGIAG